MKHTKLRSLLNKYLELQSGSKSKIQNEILRIYLAPENAAITARRKKYRHNPRVNYTEGWIEFGSKAVAKELAAHLNSTRIGETTRVVKKSSRFYDDIWNIKYLPRFKWSHLTQQLAYELKVKEQKVNQEMAQSNRESKMYLRNVSKAKMINAIEARKMKHTDSSLDASEKPSTASKVPLNPAGIARQYKQRPVIESDQKKNSISLKLFQ